MISEKNARKMELSKEELMKSSLPSQEKEDLIEALENSLEGTNGLTPEQKIQNLSESIFSLVRLFVNARCSAGVKTWKDVLVNCKREILWALYGLFILLFFHPEIAALLKGVAENG